MMKTTYNPPLGRAHMKLVREILGMRQYDVGNLWNDEFNRIWGVKHLNSTLTQFDARIGGIDILNYYKNKLLKLVGDSDVSLSQKELANMCIQEWSKFPYYHEAKWREIV